MSSLYLDHFGLSKPPFQITPDLDFFFSGGRRGDILSALLHVAGHEEGIITVVAEVGSGMSLASPATTMRASAARVSACGCSASSGSAGRSTRR